MRDHIIGSVKSLEDLHLSEEALVEKLKILIKKVEDHGFSVRYGNKDECMINSKLLIIHGRQKTINKIFSLAHEFGHALTIPKCIGELGSESFYKRYGSWPSLEYEIKAWIAADKLVRKLRLYTSEYIAYKHKCLRSHYTSTKS